MRPHAPIYLRRVALATMFAGAAAVAGTAAGDPATAYAEPREWDIGEYDDCMGVRADLNVLGVISNEALADETRMCCERSGGVWGVGFNGEAGCVAPQPRRPNELPQHHLSFRPSRKRHYGCRRLLRRRKP